jgi:exopolysaccharide production protein ExoY
MNLSMQQISQVRAHSSGVRHFGGPGVGQTQFAPARRFSFPGPAIFDAGQAELEATELVERPVPWWKRPLDFCLILLGAPGVALIFLVASVYIKLVSRGPVFFVQERVGRDGKTFRCLKFRTMEVDNDTEVHKNHLVELMKSDRPMQKLDATGDKRIIPFGKLLRSSGLDELPQLINVLRGEMSVIGPRPCTPYEYALYEPWQKERVSVLPGLTGLWQVSGKNRTTFEEMIRLDIRYSRGLSLTQDLTIIAKTPPVLLLQMRDQWDARRRAASAARPGQPRNAQPESA